MGTSTSWNPQGPSRPVMGLLLPLHCYFYLKQEALERSLWRKCRSADWAVILIMIMIMGVWRISVKRNVAVGSAWNSLSYFEPSPFRISFVDAG